MSESFVEKPSTFSELLIEFKVLQLYALRYFHVRESQRNTCDKTTSQRLCPEENTLEPRYNEGPRDWQNLFAIPSFRF